MSPATALPPLTPEQERMVEENLGLFIHVLKRYNRDLRYEWDDAYQYGCMGLVEAVRNYNPEKGAAFSSFAVRCIYFSVHRWELYNTRKKNSFGKNTVNYSLEYRTPYMPKPREFHEMLIPPDYVSMEDELAKKGTDSEGEGVHEHLPPRSTAFHLAGFHPACAHRCRGWQNGGQNRRAGIRHDQEIHAPPAHLRRKDPYRIKKRSRRAPTHRLPMAKNNICSPQINARFVS